MPDKTHLLAGARKFMSTSGVSYRPHGANPKQSHVAVAYGDSIAPMSQKQLEEEKQKVQRLLARFGLIVK